MKIQMIKRDCWHTQAKSTVFSAGHTYDVRKEVADYFINKGSANRVRIRRSEPTSISNDDISAVTDE